MKQHPDNIPKPATSDSRSSTAATPASGPPASNVPPFPVPDHTLIRRVGKGSYGEVWLARNALGTWRAVKIVRRSAFDDDRPYEREFAGIQRFEPISRSHESQLNILQVGRAEDGFYYVMEVADDMSAVMSGNAGFPTGEPGSAPTPAGKSAIQPDTYTPRNLRSELLLRGRLPVDECIRLGLALTTALEHLHRHGLVHRDIKPSNIVFVNGIPKLADIGLVAKAEATMTFVGTEGFLPPEGPGTRQADIYSLGKVLYELSTGHDRHQFPELPTNIVELPDRPLLGELNEVLIKACHRDPAQRYQTAAEMHADLALLESGQSIVRLHGIERRLRFVQRAGAIAAALATVIALGWWWQARQTRLVRELATDNSRLLRLEKTAHDQARQSEADTQRVLQFLLKRVVSAARPPDEDGQGMGRDITVLRALEAAEAGIPETFDGQPLAELELRRSLAATYRYLGLPTNEAVHRQRALQLSEALFGLSSAETLTNRMDLAWALQRSGLTNEGLAWLERAWQTASQSLGANDERTLMALGYVGVGYRELLRRPDSIRLLETGVQRCREAFGDDDLRTLDMVNHLAWSYYHNRQPELAVPLLEQVQTNRERILGQEHEETTRVMIDLGRAYLAVGREREAFKMLEEAYEIRRRRQGPQNQQTLIAIDSLAGSYERVGRTNDALTWFTLAMNLREAKLGDENAATVKSRNEVLRLRAVLDAATHQPAR